MAVTTVADLEDAVHSRMFAAELFGEKLTVDQARREVARNYVEYDLLHRRAAAGDVEAIARLRAEDMSFAMAMARIEADNEAKIAYLTEHTDEWRVRLREASLKCGFRMTGDRDG